MNPQGKGLAIIFHSGSYDRISHGLSIALAALALGREVRLFFTYWALENLKRDGAPLLPLDREAERKRSSLERSIERGHLQRLPQLLGQVKEMGASIHACTNSMALLNIARDELVDEVDKSSGITAFLAETAASQTLFV